MPAKQESENGQSMPAATYLACAVVALVVLSLAALMFYTPFWVITVRCIGFDPLELVDDAEELWYKGLLKHPEAYRSRVSWRWWDTKGLYVLTHPGSRETHRWGSVLRPPTVNFEDLKEYPLYQQYGGDSFEFEARFDWSEVFPALLIIVCIPLLLLYGKRSRRYST